MRFPIWFKQLVGMALTRDDVRSMIERTGREIDFTLRGRGHSIEKFGYNYACWSTPRVAEGDVIITSLGRFIITESKPCGDPPDMTFIKCIAESDEEAQR